jgi:hypothetical protein
VTAEEIGKPASHPFYAKVNEALDECQFGREAEEPCQRFHKAAKGRASIAPCVCFRALLIGCCVSTTTRAG